MNLTTEQVSKHAPAIDGFVRNSKMLQEELWIREWETKSIRRVGSTIANSVLYPDRRVRELFEVAKEEIFEPGVENAFTRGLACLINQYGYKTIDIVTRLIVYEIVNEETASQALLLFGRVEHPPSHAGRLSLLERSLRHSSTRVRNAASYSIASLDDPAAIPYLKQAIERETCGELRDDMRQALEQLESTRQCHSS
ncbi:MAG: HEAT repeat domain-containing protein [Acidobacteriota bacterium]